MHPGAGVKDGTLVNALLHHCEGELPGIGGVERPGIVHRLDRDTSGLLVAAKTEKAHRSLSAQFADHGRTGPLERAYLGICWGTPSPAKGSVDAPLGRAPNNPRKMAVRRDGRHAVTHYTVRDRLASASLVKCRLETGRTHQIRVHMTHIGHPLVGDPIYGAGFRSKERLIGEEAAKAVQGLGRQALHAYLLQFGHPESGEILHFESPRPADFSAVLTGFQAEERD